jgi:hypothetical protein
MGSLDQNKIWCSYRYDLESFNSRTGHSCVGRRSSTQKENHSHQQLSIHLIHYINKQGRPWKCHWKSIIEITFIGRPRIAVIGRPRIAVIGRPRIAVIGRPRLPAIHASLLTPVFRFSLLPLPCKVGETRVLLPSLSFMQAFSANLEMILDQQYERKQDELQ